jgi:adenylate kinase family enzyme
LPVVHLDRLYWRPGWQAPDTEGFRARVADAIAGESWISEGNYLQSFDLRLLRADLVIFLKRSRWLCLWRVLWRAVFERNRRPDLPAGCPERPDWQLLHYIWRFEAATRPYLERARIAYGAEVPVVRLGSEREIRAFLATLPRSLPSPGP